MTPPPLPPPSTMYLSTGTVVPFQTQVSHYRHTQSGTQGKLILLVYTASMTPYSADLMKQCERYINENIKTDVVLINELESYCEEVDFFIIPSAQQVLINKIRELFPKAKIFTARAVIEARAYHKIPFPIRYVGLSLAMLKCRIFLTKSCNDPSLKSKINQMCGNIVERFTDENLNVVIADRADDKYCLKAINRDVDLVTREWVEDCYNNSCQDDSALFNFDALSVTAEHKIKPFKGLTFRILDVHLQTTELKNSITFNGGSIIYCNSHKVTHVIVTKMEDSENSIKDGPKLVDPIFIEACVRAGYYLSLAEYKEFRRRKASDLAQVKQERAQQLAPREKQQVTMLKTQEVPQMSPSTTPNGNRHSTSIENRASAMLPPPPVPQHGKQTTAETHTKLIKNKALRNVFNGFENGAQTQLASSQISRIPDREIRFEQIVEPSQQLYWGE